MSSSDETDVSIASYSPLSEGVNGSVRQLTLKAVIQCKFFAKGSCSFGDHCRYRHDDEDICSLEDVSAFLIGYYCATERQSLSRITIIVTYVLTGGTSELALAAMPVGSGTIIPILFKRSHVLPLASLILAFNGRTPVRARKGINVSITMILR